MMEERSVMLGSSKVAPVESLMDTRWRYAYLSIVWMRRRIGGGRRGAVRLRRVVSFMAECGGAGELMVHCFVLSLISAVTWP